MNHVSPYLRLPLRTEGEVISERAMRELAAYVIAARDIAELRWMCPMRGTPCFDAECRTGCSVHPDNQGAHLYVEPSP